MEIDGFVRAPLGGEDARLQRQRPDARRMAPRCMVEVEEGFFDAPRVAQMGYESGVRAGGFGLRRDRTAQRLLLVGAGGMSRHGSRFGGNVMPCIYRSARSRRK
ncbi:MAG TPA: hypothetical protein VN034_10100 [Sphingopyxis sp.]|nr:hypothetical protein [Sphingopyxis sp.]